MLPNAARAEDSPDAKAPARQNGEPPAPSQAEPKPTTRFQLDDEREATPVEPTSKASSPLDLADTFDPRPKFLRYVKGAPTPPEYVYQERPRLGFLIAGGSIFAVAYGIAAIASMEDRPGNGRGFLALPLVGPWVALPLLDETTCSDLECTNDVSTAKAIALVSGFVQALGATFATIGITVKSRRFVRKDLAEVTVSPSVTASASGRSPTNYGLTVTGRF